MFIKFCSSAHRSNLWNHSSSLNCLNHLESSNSSNNLNSLNNKVWLNRRKARVMIFDNLMHKTRSPFSAHDAANCSEALPLMMSNSYMPQNCLMLQRCRYSRYTEERNHSVSQRRCCRTSRCSLSRCYRASRIAVDRGSKHTNNSAHHLQTMNSGNSRIRRSTM